MKHLVAASLSAFALLPAQAVISVSSTSFAYAQSFDTLTTTASTTVAWANDSTLAGWSLFNGAGAALATYGADAGTNTTGIFRSYGASGASDRALGALGSGGAYFGTPPTGAVAGYMAVALSNDSGATLPGFTLNFSGEQWRNGGNTSAHTMVTEYGFGASFTAVTGWTAAGGSFNFTSPVVGATAAAVDGNSAGRINGLGGAISTRWAAGDTLWVRWIDVNELGSDHGMAIDDLSFSVTPVPEVHTSALLLAGLMAIGFVAARRR
jgi:hypothetical protein